MTPAFSKIRLRCERAVSIVTPIVLGTTSLPGWRFLVFNVIGAVFWVILFAGLGWTFGAVVERWLHDAQRLQLILLGGVVVLLLGVGWLRERRVRRAAMDARDR